MLRLDGITKRFGDRTVLDDVTFEVGVGRMTGFVGGNGAGKTTTMRVVLGVLHAESGTVTLSGSPLSQAMRSRFGYMPEERGLYPKMKVREQIVYLGRLHGMPTKDAHEKATELLVKLGLEERLDDTLENLSLGNQQRAQIAASLIHDPDVLVLDEPFSGLDPLAVDVVQGVLKDYADRGVPVLFSSHQLDIVERLCDDLIVIADGSIRASGSRDVLRKEHSRDRYELETTDGLGWLDEIPGCTVIERDGSHAVFESSSPEAAHAVLAHAVEKGLVLRFAPQHPTLAEIFKEVIR